MFPADEEGADDEQRADEGARVAAFFTARAEASAVGAHADADSDSDDDAALDAELEAAHAERNRRRAGEAATGREVARLLAQTESLVAQNRVMEAVAAFTEAIALQPHSVPLLEARAS